MRTPSITVLALVLCACPVGPKDDPPKDEPADSTTGQQEPPEPDPQTAKPPTPKGEPAPSMERAIVMPKAGK